MRAASLVLAALVASACSGDQGGFGQQPAPSPTPVPTSLSTPPPLRRVAVAAGPGLRFEPTRLRAEAGTALEVTLENGDDRPHTLVVEELSLLMLAGAGQTVTTAVAIHPDRVGSFVFYCQIPGHRAGGMAGRIVVAAPR